MHLCLGIQETIYLLFHYASLHSGKDKWTIYLEHFDVAFICLNYAPVNVNPHTPGNSRAFKGIFSYLTSERALGIGDFDAFCMPFKNSGGMDHGIFHQGGLGQESLIWQDGGYEVVCLFKFWSTF